MVKFIQHNTPLLLVSRQFKYSKKGDVVHFFWRNCMKTPTIIIEPKKIEKDVINKLSTIKTVDDLNRVGDLYHVVVQIEYWLDCLIESNPIIQMETLEEVSNFLNKIGLKAG
jgi:hypothetical protein